MVNDTGRPREERTLADLFGDLSRETATLVRQEVTLASTEISHKATRAAKDIGFLLGGAAVLYAGFLGVMAAIAFALAVVMPLWLGSLIVAVIVAASGYMLVRQGLGALKKEDLAPRQTLESLKEDAQWAKEQTS